MRPLTGVAVLFAVALVISGAPFLVKWALPERKSDPAPAVEAQKQPAAVQDDRYKWDDGTTIRRYDDASGSTIFWIIRLPDGREVMFRHSVGVAFIGRPLVTAEAAQ